MPGGLQVRRRDGSWTDVHPAPGSFVCNLGDMMMRWTNDYWVSTPHRVVNPPREFAGLDRISLVFFHMPNHDAEIACIDRRLAPGDAPNYPPIACADYFAAKYLPLGGAGARRRHRDRHRRGGAVGRALRYGARAPARGEGNGECGIE